ncbi:helix-turn-helix domain-containing protein [Chryseobacterium sp.]|uniref:helix-turn-helix transcriptional regulator n=1 Tax=Chryseobacterium sp. TaxID=1871047 RepID=UPI00321AEE9C
MSTQINQDVIKAREVVAGYKELNKGTIEEMSYYDPILKLRRYKKVLIDPNSKDFVKLYGKKKNEPKEKKDIPIKKPKIITKTIKKIIKSKPKPKVKTVHPKTILSKENIEKAYSMHVNNCSTFEISKELNVNEKTVLTYILAKKKELGSFKNRYLVQNEKVLQLKRENKSIAEICEILNITDSAVYRHLRMGKTEEDKNKEREEVYKAILAKMKVNSSDYVYSVHVTPKKCKLTHLTIMDVCKYYNELIDMGRLIVSSDPIAKSNGKKIMLPIA